MTKLATLSGALLVKLSVFVKRKEGLSQEDFFRYWTEHHAPLFMSLEIAKSNVIQYVQFQIEANATADLGKLATIAPFDGVGIFYGRSSDDLLAIFTDPEYLARAHPDEANFLDGSAAQAMIGYDFDLTDA
ncbi:hypothetical protein EXIGLDRAFT_306369 [Exidia glandulosa HHB12029]|uniref:EthD domain-containing protein n=1 Tax=Exidia glandulosa HHB12029 TaxID=1314781 RepID=A0A165D3D8_EXIGL|nr:hypothetical protein EXIGLDRAFT_306369 [Exidia glandulosa HHB12029]